MPVHEPDDDRHFGAGSVPGRSCNLKCVCVRSALPPPPVTVHGVDDQLAAFWTLAVSPPIKALSVIATLEPTVEAVDAAAAPEVVKLT